MLYQIKTYYDFVQNVTHSNTFFKAKTVLQLDLFHLIYHLEEVTKICVFMYIFNYRFSEKLPFCTTMESPVGAKNGGRKTAVGT